MTRYNHINMSCGFIKLILTLVMVMSMSIGSDTTHVVSAFVTPQGRFQQSPMTAKTTQSYTSSAAAWKSSSTTTTRLQERQWNFNEGQGPFGLKKNAETWNGRVAQMAFLFVFLQELIFGKGVVQGLTDGDPIYIACAVLFFASVGGLTLFLAIKGPDNYVDNDLGRK